MNPPSISNSNLNSNYNSHRKNGLKSSSHYIQPTNAQKGDTVSFGSLGGGIKHGVKNGLTNIFKFIDNSSFFIEFLIVDAVSLILPRIWIGLNRDKEKTGKFNYKAGKEEAGREILSGPAMNLIPMGVLTAVSALKPASHMDRKTIKGLNSHMKNIVANANPIALTDKKVLKEKLADKLFDEIFGENFAEKEKIQQYKNEFKAALIKSTEEKPRSLFETISRKPNVFGNYSDEFAEKVTELKNKGVKAPINSASVTINGKEIEATALFEDFHNYSKDILEKFVKQVDTKELTKNNNKNVIQRVVLNLYDKVTGKTAEAIKACKDKSAAFLDTLTNNRLKLKTGTAIAGFLAVGSFLLYLPSVYQQKGLSPAQESARRASKGEHGGANENK